MFTMGSYVPSSQHVIYVKSLNAPMMRQVQLLFQLVDKE